MHLPFPKYLWRISVLFQLVLIAHYTTTTTDELEFCRLCIKSGNIIGKTQSDVKYDAQCYSSGIRQGFAQEHNTTDFRGYDNYISIVPPSSKGYQACKIEILRNGDVLEQTLIITIRSSSNNLENTWTYKKEDPKKINKYRIDARSDVPGEYNELMYKLHIINYIYLRSKIA